MRQIHAAMGHLQRGDSECAMTLAAAGDGMLPSTDEPEFRELARMTEVNDIVDWLRHGPMKDKENRRRGRGHEESEAIFVISRDSKIGRRLRRSKDASDRQLSNLRNWKLKNRAQRLRTALVSHQK
jgi:hypothetical protein